MNRSYNKIRHIQESNLRLEKKFLHEQSTTNSDLKPNEELVDEVFEKISSAMSGMGTDEDTIMDALYKLAPRMEQGKTWEQSVAQKREDYKYLLQKIKEEGYGSLVKWLKSDVGSPLSSFISSPYEKDNEILDYAEKLEDILSGKTNHL